LTWKLASLPVRLENVLRVIDALGGEIQLSGLPNQAEGGTQGA
jgi:hypothetical protein